EPGFVPRERYEGEVGGAALALAGARVLGKPGAREEVAAAFVEGDGEHVRVVVEDLLHAIAVMHVDVDVGDAVSVLLEPVAGDRRIVVRAEARGAAAVRVMESAGRAERMQGGAARHRLGGD